MSKNIKSKDSSPKVTEVTKEVKTILNTTKVSKKDIESSKRKEEKKKEKIAKQINNKNSKLEKYDLKKDLTQSKKELILLNANAQADRIIEAEIKKIDQAKNWATKYEQMKKEADDKRLAAAKFKREAKNKVRATLMEYNKSIPKITKEVTKNQLALEKKYISNLFTKNVAKFARFSIETLQKLIVEQDQLESPIPEDMAVLKQALIQAIERNKRKEKNQKHALNRIKHKTKKLAQPKEETKRIKALTPEERKAEYRKFKAEAELRFKNSGVIPNSNTSKRKEENEKANIRREQLAKHRITRMTKKIAVELAAKQKRDADVKRFLDSEKKRITRKNAKATYLTKGGIPAIRTTKKVALDEKRARDYVANANNKLKAEENKSNNIRYSINTVYFNEENKIVEKTTCFVYTLSAFEKQMNKIHTRNMENMPDKYIGIFAYDVDNTILKESINEKFLEIDGKPTSRMGNKNKTQKIKPKAAA